MCLPYIILNPFNKNEAHECHYTRAVVIFVKYTNITQFLKIRAGRSFREPTFSEPNTGFHHYFASYAQWKLIRYIIETGYSLSLTLYIYIKHFSY